MAERIETFDDITVSEYDGLSNREPFQHRKEKDDEGTLQWLKNNFEDCSRNGEPRMDMYRRLNAIYKGKNYRSTSSGDSTKKLPRMSVNLIYEMVEHRVSQTSKLKTSISLIPNNNESSDINNAKACKKMLDCFAEQSGFEYLNVKGDRVLFKYGGVFFFVLWCKNKGDYHPGFVSIKDQVGEKEALKIFHKLFGKDQNPRIGDVIVKMVPPNRVFVELGKECFEDLNHIEFYEWVHIEEVKAEYPDVAKDIHEEGSSIYKYSLHDYDSRENWVMVRYFFHKKTQFLPNGEYIKYVNDVILERTDYPYDENILPCVMDTDIELDNEFWSRSFVTQIEQLQRFSNNLWSSVARDYAVASAAKWVMPKGAARHSQFNNELALLEYTGAVAPTLVRNTPTSPQVFEIQDRIDAKVSKISRVFDISRGNPPPGITANSALRFLDEQEAQTLFPIVQKRNLRVVSLYKMILCRMAQFYKESDGRITRMLGKDNGYFIKSFKKADFTKIYDVKIANSPALPDTKGGKINAIIDLNMATQTDPIFKKEEIIQMMDLALDDTFKDEATIAVTAAKTMLDMILEGEQVPPPRNSDNLLVHYGIFMRAVQENDFKTRPPEVIAAIDERLTILEGLMWERAQKNPTFGQKLMMIDSFPSFFTPPDVPTLPPIAPAPPAGGGMDTSQIKPQGAAEQQ